MPELEEEGKSGSLSEDYKYILYGPSYYKYSIEYKLYNTIVVTTATVCNLDPRNS